MGVYGVEPMLDWEAMDMAGDQSRRLPVKVYTAGMRAQEFDQSPKLQQAKAAAAENHAERKQWALLAEENRLLRSRVEHARLAQENAFMRWQLQLQQQQLQAMAMCAPTEGLACLGPGGAGQRKKDVASKMGRNSFSHKLGNDSHMPSPKTPSGFDRFCSDEFGMDEKSTIAPESPGMVSTASDEFVKIKQNQVVTGSEKTTCMLRNLPNPYTREHLVDLLDKCGFAGKYTFVYVPMDFKTEANLGYAFVDMVSQEAAELLHHRVQGFRGWAPVVYGSEKVCEVAWSDALQGLGAHIERYRNSPVMHESVPPSFKPLIFVNGVAVPFPAPTKKIRAPRQWVRKHVKD